MRAGEYLRIEEIDGRLPSKVFNLHLQRNGKELRFWNPATQGWLPTTEERRVEAEREYKFESYRREIAEKERELERKQRQWAEREIERQEAQHSGVRCGRVAG